MTVREEGLSYWLKGWFNSSPVFCVEKEPQANMEKEP